MPCSVFSGVVHRHKNLGMDSGFFCLLLYQINNIYFAGFTLLKIFFDYELSSKNDFSEDCIKIRRGGWLILLLRISLDVVVCII
jgi:hypothetical protein